MEFFTSTKKRLFEAAKSIGEGGEKIFQLDYTYLSNLTLTYYFKKMNLYIVFKIYKTYISYTLVHYLYSFKEIYDRIKPRI